MGTAPDFSHYPQTEAFKSFTERPVADNTLLDITAFDNNDWIAHLYTVTEKGEAIYVREVYDWAHQNVHYKQLSAAELKSLREAIRQLPAKNAYPPLDRLVIVRFREGANWTSRSFDNLALPEPMRRIYDIHGEREESRREREQQKQASGAQDKDSPAAGKVDWKARAALVKPGMKRSEVEAILPPYEGRKPAKFTIEGLGHQDFDVYWVDADSQVMVGYDRKDLTSGYVKLEKKPCPPELNIADPGILEMKPEDLKIRADSSRSQIELPRMPAVSSAVSPKNAPETKPAKDHSTSEK